MKCYAEQYYDTMVCKVCKLKWNTNDSTPPSCRPLKDLTLPEIRAIWNVSLREADRIKTCATIHSNISDAKTVDDLKIILREVVEKLL